IDNHTSGTLTVLNTTLSNNTAANDGGAIDNAGTATITDSTIALNSAGLGGGIHNAGTLTVVSATIADNKATNSGQGGGLNAASGMATLYDTIIALNTSGGGTALNDIAGSVSSASSHNLVDDAGSAGGLTNGTNANIVGVSPGFAKAGLTDNGGPTQTIALAAGS